MTGILADRSTEKRAGEALIREADDLACQSWNERKWADGGPTDPSPTVDEAINGGYSWLEIRSSQCRTPCSVDLAGLRRVAAVTKGRCRENTRCSLQRGGLVMGLTPARLQATWVERLCSRSCYDWPPTAPTMSLTAYFDESGTHGGSPGVVVAGFISMPGGWRSYETELASELSRRGLRVFHAIELRSERYKSLHDAHSKIIRRNVLWGISVTLKSSDYKKTYYKVPGLPRRTRLNFSMASAFACALWPPSISSVPFQETGR